MVRALRCGKRRRHTRSSRRKRPTSPGSAEPSNLDETVRDPVGEMCPNPALAMNLRYEGVTAEAAANPRCLGPSLDAWPDNKIEAFFVWAVSKTCSIPEHAGRSAVMKEEQKCAFAGPL